VTLFRLNERRDLNLENPGVPLSAVATADWLFGGRRSVAGVDVTETSALGASAVYRGVSLISGVAGALPLNTVKTGSFDKVASILVGNEHPEMTSLEFWRLSYVHRLLWGNFYAQKIYDIGGQLRWLYPISPDRVKVARIKPSAGNPGGKLFTVRDDAGQVHVRTSRDIFHIPGLGYDGVTGVSPIRIMATTVGFGMAAEEYGARLFANGTMLSGVLQTEQRLDPDQADALKKRWREKLTGLQNAHDVAILDSGAKFSPMTMPNVDAQFVESRQFQVSELTRFLGVPPFLMFEMQKSTSWGTGLEQQATGWVIFDLHPNWLAPTEARVTKELTQPGVSASYDVRGLMRGDSKARAEYFTAMWNTGAFSSNDIRRVEGEPPIEGGDVYHTPLNMAPAPKSADTQPVTDNPEPDPEGADE